MEIKDGYYDGQVLSAKIIKARYAKEGENRMEVRLECGVFDSDRKPMSERAEVFLELSSDYPKFGNTTVPFWQQTLDRLHEMGFSGQDLTTLQAQLKDKPVRLNYRTVDKQGTPLKNGPQWYLSAARVIEELAPATANAMLQQMMAGGTFPAPAAAAPAPKSNPFE